MLWILPFIILVAFEIVADIFSKEWVLHSGWLRWCLAMAFYLGCNIFWLFALKQGLGLGRSAAIFSISTVIVAVLLGVFMYKESLYWPQLVGIGTGIVSIILILSYGT